jgi:hypothetical protein
MLLGHLSRQPLTEVGRFLVRMRTTEDIAQVAAQGIGLVDEDSRASGNADDYL